MKTVSSPSPGEETTQSECPVLFYRVGIGGLAVYSTRSRESDPKVRLLSFRLEPSRQRGQDCHQPPRTQCSPNIDFFTSSRIFTSEKGKVLEPIELLV